MPDSKPTTEESFQDQRPYRAEREMLTHDPKLTTEGRFALKAKGAIGAVANYLWDSITDTPSRLERNRRSNEDYLGKMLAYTGVQVDRLLEIPRAVGRISEAYDKGEPYNMEDITNVNLALLAAGPARGDFRLAGPKGSAIRQKWKLKEGVARQMTTKNPGYRFGAQPEYTKLDAGILPYSRDIEDSTQAVLRAMDKLPDEEFRIQKIDMLNEAEYVKEAAQTGHFGGFYEYSILEDVSRIAIPYREPPKTLIEKVVHEVTHGTLQGAKYRPVKGAPFLPKSQQGNRPISIEDKTLFKSVQVSSPRSVPYADRPTEITSRIVANVVKAMPSKLFKEGKIPQTVFDGIVRAAAKASLKGTKPVSSAPTIKGTKGWKAVPHYKSIGGTIMTKGKGESMVKINEKLDRFGDTIYEVQIGNLKFPDRFSSIFRATDYVTQLHLTQ